MHPVVGHDGAVYLPAERTEHWPQRDEITCFPPNSKPYCFWRAAYLSRDDRAIYALRVGESGVLYGLQISNFALQPEAGAKLLTMLPATRCAQGLSTCLSLTLALSFSLSAQVLALCVFDMGVDGFFPFFVHSRGDD